MAQDSRHAGLDVSSSRPPEQPELCLVRKWPARGDQIRELLFHIGQPGQQPRHLFVWGSRDTGKTSIAR